MRWLVWGSVILAIAFYFTGMLVDNDVWSAILISLYIILYALAFYILRLVEFCTIDEENGVVFSSENKKHPMRIDSIKTIMYKESKKGRFRSLFIHDNNIGFFNIRTTKKKADEIVARLTAINPAIEVTHANYL